MFEIGDKVILKKQYITNKDSWFKDNLGVGVVVGFGYPNDKNVLHVSWSSAMCIYAYLSHTLELEPKRPYYV